MKGMGVGKGRGDVRGTRDNARSSTVGAKSAMQMWHGRRSIGAARVDGRFASPGRNDKSFRVSGVPRSEIWHRRPSRYRRERGGVY